MLMTLSCTLHFQGFPTAKPECLITQHAKDALKDFLKHGEFGRTEVGEKDEVIFITKSVPNHIFIILVKIKSSDRISFLIPC